MAKKKSQPAAKQEEAAPAPQHNLTRLLATRLADRAIVSPPERDGSITASFRLQTHSQREPYRDVRLILERDSIRVAGAEPRTPLRRRLDLNLPEEPPGRSRRVG